MDYLKLLGLRSTVNALTVISNLAKPKKAKPSLASSPVKADASQAQKSEKKDVKVEAKKDVKIESKPTQKKKSFWHIDADYLAVVILLVIVLFGAKTYALSIEAPTQPIIINDKAVFSVDLINDSDIVENIELSFYSPVVSKVSYPKQLAPHSTSTANITVTNTLNKVQDVFATIEVVVGEVKVQKRVTLAFKENPNLKLNNALTGFFSFGAFWGEVSNFGFWDWVIFVILVIIAAVLLVAFVARISRRNYSQKNDLGDLK